MASIKCCKDCNDRYRITDTPFIEDCHDHCDRYKAEKKAMDELKKKKIDEQRSNFMYHNKTRNRNEVYHSKLGVYEKRSD